MGFAWPDAEEGGEDDGEEEAVEVDAARQVLGVLLGGACREEQPSRRWRRRRRRARCDGRSGHETVGHVRCARWLVGGDDDVNLRAAARGGAEAVGGIDVGREEGLRGPWCAVAAMSLELDDGVVVAVAVTAGAVAIL